MTICSKIHISINMRVHSMTPRCIIHSLLALQTNIWMKQKAKFTHLILHKTIVNMSRYISYRNLNILFLKGVSAIIKHCRRGKNCHRDIRYPLVRAFRSEDTADLRLPRTARLLPPETMILPTSRLSHGNIPRQQRHVRVSSWNVAVCSLVGGLRMCWPRRKICVNFRPPWPQQI